MSCQGDRRLAKRMSEGERNPPANEETILATLHYLQSFGTFDLKSTRKEILSLRSE